ncbi:MAG: hypothetical protein Q8920_15470 [Bacillota bacterium]|nr:hypothetical protein [Bacillota bacterium]
MPKIFADFARMVEARKTVEELKKMGYKDAHLDMAEKFSNEFASEINAPGTSRAVSLSALVLKSNGHIYNVGKAPLLAADPMVSGSGHFEETADLNARLRVTVDDDKLDEIREILSKAGGKLQ